MARKKLAAQQAQARMHVSNVAQAKMAQMQRQQQQQQGRIRTGVFSFPESESEGIVFLG